MSQTYEQLNAAKQQLETALETIVAHGGDAEALKLARYCFTEGMEHLVYAARQQLQQDGVYHECPECGRRFEMHHGDRCSFHPDVPATITKS
jgi:hypothetical protein